MPLYYTFSRSIWQHVFELLDANVNIYFLQNGIRKDLVKSTSKRLHSVGRDNSLNAIIKELLHKYAHNFVVVN